MKLTIREILDMNGALPALCAEALPVKVKYWLSRDCETLQKHPAVKQFIKSRNDLVTKYGKPNKDGQPEVAANSPEMKLFEADVEALLAMEEEAELHPQKLADLGSGPMRADLSKLLKLIIPE